MPDSRKSTKDLIERAHGGDENARELLITENMGLIWSIVKRFAGRGHDLEDLFQIGCIGLIKAVDKFDTSFDVCFSTYAVPVISGEVRRFIRDDGMVKVSRTLKENAVRVMRGREELSLQSGGEPGLARLSEHIGLSIEEIVMCLEASREVDSVNRTLYRSDGGEVTMLDRVVDRCESGTAVASPENEWKDYEKEKLLDRMVLGEELGRLSPKERRIIWLRYYRERTQAQVARELGMSQVQVSRTEKRIILELRKRMMG